MRVPAFGFMTLLAPAFPMCTPGIAVNNTVFTPTLNARVPVSTVGEGAFALIPGKINHPLRQMTCSFNSASLGVLTGVSLWDEWAHFSFCQGTIFFAVV